MDEINPILVEEFKEVNDTFKHIVGNMKLYKLKDIWILEVTRTHGGHTYNHYYSSREEARDSVNFYAKVYQWQGVKERQYAKV